MKTGYLVLGLGILGIIVGASMYVAGFHHTIGLGGMGLGVILVLLGAWLSSGTQKKTT
jgi:hypothetical protein